MAVVLYLHILDGYCPPFPAIRAVPGGVLPLTADPCATGWLLFMPGLRQHTVRSVLTVAFCPLLFPSVTSYRQTVEYINVMEHCFLVHIINIGIYCGIYSMVSDSCLSGDWRDIRIISVFFWASRNKLSWQFRPKNDYNSILTYTMFNSEEMLPCCPLLPVTQGVNLFSGEFLWQQVVDVLHFAENY